jgi:UDP-N-acetyl-D-galactosamine dehydrogenase
MNIKNIKLCIIGLGYVGLPLAVEFSKKRNVIGFDISSKRIKELKTFNDNTLEVSAKELRLAKNLTLTDQISDIKNSNCYIVTVPTPINSRKEPDLKPIRDASKVIGGLLKKDDIVVYESTVYPGCTEEFCVPILEKYSHLKFNKDFFCGYSPERINPGDKKHRLKDIKKITSGSDPLVAKLINTLYSEIILAGTHMAKSIKIAEAAKVIENTQRDLNIAFINELSKIFSIMQIDTNAVLEAAKTKWNFITFAPGLVGGHCIGVDPYYLTYKAKKIGYNPKIILSGRKLNDSMDSYVVSKFIKKMKEKSIKIKNSKILMMGLTFKENCPDLRNSGSYKIFKKMKKKNMNIDIFDPLADQKEIKKLYNTSPIKKFKTNFYDGVLLLVAHKYFINMGLKKILKMAKSKKVILDLKYIFRSQKIDLRL